MSGQIVSGFDPAWKISAALVFSAGISQVSTVPAAALACLASLTVIIVGKVHPGMMCKRLIPVNFFFLFLWLTLPLGITDRPDTFAAWGPLRFHTAGVYLALCITLKGNAIALAILALIDSSSVTENARALLRLRVPQKFVTLILLTHANLFLMRRECTRLFQAAKLRGFSPSMSLRTVRAYAWLLGMLLVRSWQRSRNVGQAMTLRGFNGRFPLLETRRPVYRGTACSIGLLAGSLLAPLVLLAWETCAGGWQ